MAAAAATSIQKATPQQPIAVEITTPRWLSGSLVLIWILTLAFVITSVVAVREHRDALKAIANDSARSVVAAERIASALADMDANAANGLLSVQTHASALAAYDKSRGQMAEALVDAAQNITFQGEKDELKGLAKNGGVYSEQVGAAFTLHDSNPPAALENYRKAAQLLDKTLMPSARKIDKINRDELDASYNSIGRSSTVQMALVWLAGLAMLAVMLRVQFFLSDRMRRTLNPLCLFATVSVAVLLLYTSHALSTSAQQIKIVKADAFESIHGLWQAKAIAYEANALESRYLLDKQAAGQHQATFMAMAQALSNDPEKLLRGSRSGKPAPDSTGFLADQARLITFEGERKATSSTIDWWIKYIQIDKTIRERERLGKHDEAIQLCLGENPNQSNWAFNNFMKSLDEVLKINQDAFDQAAATGFEALDKFEIISPVVGLMAALACLFGLLPRIREYSS